MAPLTRLGIDCDRSSAEVHWHTVGRRYTAMVAIDAEVIVRDGVCPEALR